MLILLSPSKTLNFDACDRMAKPTQPALLDEAKTLAAIMKDKSAEEIGKLMSISDKLAELNYGRYQDFATPFTSKNAKAAILAFKGDVYDGFDVDTLPDDALMRANDRVRILSGLYGLLKPSDLIQPYRLEMGTKLNNTHGKDLYTFWGDRITEELNRQMEAANTDTVLNLASNEYFNAVNPKKLNGRLITAQFKEMRGNQLKVISFNAKRARGMMARHITSCKTVKDSDIKAFSEADYRFSPELSTENTFLFAK